MPCAIAAVFAQTAAPCEAADAGSWKLLSDPDFEHAHLPQDVCEGRHQSCLLVCLLGAEVQNTILQAGEEAAQ